MASFSLCACVEVIDRKKSVNTSHPLVRKLSGVNEFFTALCSICVLGLKDIDAIAEENV